MRFSDSKSVGKIPRGFTLVEILVALSIMGILFGAAYANYRDFSRRQALLNSAKTIQGDLRLTQAAALAGQLPADINCTGSNNLNGYFFKVLAANHYEIRASCTGGSVLNPKKDVILTNGINIAAPFPVPNPILFKVLGAGTNIAVGTFSTIIVSQAGTGKSTSITISAGGQVQ